MLESWTPVLVFLILVTGFAVVSLFGSWLLGMKKPRPEKLVPYECGMTPIGTARGRMSVKFYLVAMIFLLFDIEVAFLYPWALALRALGWAGYVQVVLFTLVLMAGYIFVWKKGALDWSQT